jgi:hypothetical protein
MLRRRVVIHYLAMYPIASPNTQALQLPTIDQPLDLSTRSSRSRGANRATSAPYCAAVRVERVAAGPLFRPRENALTPRGSTPACDIFRIRRGAVAAAISQSPTLPTRTPPQRAAASKRSQSEQTSLSQSCFVSSTTAMPPPPVAIDREPTIRGTIEACQKDMSYRYFPGMGTRFKAQQSTEGTLRQLLRASGECGGPILSRVIELDNPWAVRTSTLRALGFKGEVVLQHENALLGTMQQQVMEQPGNVETAIGWVLDQVAAISREARFNLEPSDEFQILNADLQMVAPCTAAIRAFMEDVLQGIPTQNAPAERAPQPSGADTEIARQAALAYILQVTKRAETNVRVYTTQTGIPRVVIPITINQLQPLTGRDSRHNVFGRLINTQGIVASVHALAKRFGGSDGSGASLTNRTIGEEKWSLLNGNLQGDLILLDIPDGGRKRANFLYEMKIPIRRAWTKGARVLIATQMLDETVFCALRDFGLCVFDPIDSRTVAQASRKPALAANFLPQWPMTLLDLPPS